MPPSVRYGRDSLDLKEKLGNNVEVEENAQRDEYLERYELIRNKSPEELKALEKSLVRKLDWKFLPMVTLMLVMKSVPSLHGPSLVRNHLVYHF